MENPNTSTLSYLFNKYLHRSFERGVRLPDTEFTCGSVKINRGDFIKTFEEGLNKYLLNNRIDRIRS